MKTILLLLALITISLFSEATIYTVSNNPLIPAQFSTIINAINTASAGDSIYVQGSPVIYSGGDIHISKTLTLIGSGANPDKQNPIASMIGSPIYLDGNITGSVIEGFSFVINCSLVGSNFNNNITVARNKFIVTHLYVTGDNWVIKNNIFITGTVYVQNHLDCRIENNIFNEFFQLNVIDCYPAIQGSFQSSVSINHNLFLGANFCQFFSQINGATFANNIFYAAIVRLDQVTSCIINNNLTFQTGQDLNSFGTNTGSGNSMQDPLFINAPVDSIFNYTYNYHLQPSSPGHNAATDGSDIGIYGGTYPFIDLTGSANIPQITLMDISNPTLVPGDSIHVHIQARKHN